MSNLRSCVFMILFSSLMVLFGTTGGIVGADNFSEIKSGAPGETCSLTQTCIRNPAEEGQLCPDANKINNPEIKFAAP